MAATPETRWKRLRAELGAWRKYPKDAVTTLRAERESFRPLMLAELGALSNDPDPLTEDAIFFLHIHLLALLAEWREAAAWPCLLRLLRRMDKQRYEAIHGAEGCEYLVPLIATLMPAGSEPLDEMEVLLETPEVSIWLRGNVLDALIMRVEKGVLSREELIPRLRKALATERAFQLARDIEARDEILSTCMLSSLARLGDAGSVHLVQPLFDEGLVDPMYWGDVDSYLDYMQGKKIWSEKYPQNWVDDAIVFTKEHFYQQKKKKFRETWYPEDEATLSKPGRNDPCPCGSGKKYKKCCGA
jgi:hypothetical protein